MSFETDAVRIALDKMLNGSSFSICDLDRIGKAIGIDPGNSKAYRFLRLLHCVDYSDMTSTVRNQIPEMVMRCLDPRGKVNVDVLAKALLIEGNDHLNTEDNPLYLIDG